MHIMDCDIDINWLLWYDFQNLKITVKGIDTMECIRISRNCHLPRTAAAVN